MNLLLFTPEEAVQNPIRLTDRRRVEHLRAVLKIQPGARLRAGVLNGLTGEAEVLETGEGDVLLSFTPSIPPPAPHPLTLIVALPRPKSFKKVLWASVTFGVKEIHFIHTARTDKAYWQTPFLAPDSLEYECTAALEQARDTRMPSLCFHRRFKPFAEDVLPSLTEKKQPFLFHGGEGAKACPPSCAGASVAAIGPEGGFVPFEAELFERSGFKRVHLGERVLRVEQAVCAVAARLCSL